MEKELENLERLGVITPVPSSLFGTPIVPVVKEDRSIELRGDYRTTLNEVLAVKQYPLPKLDELFSVLFRQEVLF